MLKIKKIKMFIQMLFLICAMGACSVEVQPVVTTPEKPSPEIPVKKPIKESVKIQVDSPVEVPVEKPIEKPAEKPVEKPAEKPIEKPVDQPIEKPKFIVENPDDVLVLVNRDRFLPRNYKPILTNIPKDYTLKENQKLKPDVVASFIQMVDALKLETGLTLYATSTYRTHEYQENLFNRYVKNRGYAEAIRISAKPGTSEHQTGLTLDVETASGTMFKFGETEQSKWVEKNAHRFGFIVRYEAQFESITGYMAEPWHLRYVGEHAGPVYESKRPFEEYYFKLGLK